MGRVATAFNAMANEVQSHHRALEQQVAERTAALEEAMEELERAQDEVVRTARLATLGQLAGGVGHELRNPLGVMTNAVFVLETIVANPDPMVRDYLGILKTQIALSEKIVADLLDFARIKPASRAPVSLFAVVSQQIGRLGALGKTRVEYDFPDALPPADVDGVQIGQVVLNLVSNAVQAMGEPGGVVSCRGRHDGNGTLTLDVSDTGPGMPDDVARRLFEPLFTTKARGLGLGLAVSRMLAENNGGRLTFVSRFGIGTTFTLAVPAAHRTT
jgi:signal transduction histidine kinase